MVPDEKRLRIGMTLGNAQDLPDHSSGPRPPLDDIYSATARAGYAAMQGGDRELCQAHGLAVIGSGIIPGVSDVEPFVARWKQLGAISATCIAGYGFESDSETDALVGKILEVAQSYQLAVFIETHRASITQDAWRTAQLTSRIPHVRFNGDFSHWFTGQEMLYGDFNERLARLAPVFDRVRFLHGRIGARGCVQVDIGEQAAHTSVPYFRKLWTRAMEGFLRAEDAGPDLWFCPELLGTEYGYAHLTRASDGRLVEDGDRWEQAKLLVSIAQNCFAEASRQITTPLEYHASSQANH